MFVRRTPNHVNSFPASLLSTNGLTPVCGRMRTGSWCLRRPRPILVEVESGSRLVSAADSRTWISMEGGYIVCFGLCSVFVNPDEATHFSRLPLLDAVVSPREPC